MLASRAQHLPYGLLRCGAAHATAAAALGALLGQVAGHGAVHAITVLLTGPRGMHITLDLAPRSNAAGTGKTALAMHALLNATVHVVKLIDAASLLAMPESKRGDYIVHAFADAYKPNSTSLVVLDDLDGLVELTSVGANVWRLKRVARVHGHQLAYNHAVLHALATVLSAPPPANTSVLVVGTAATGSLQSLRDLFRVHLEAGGRHNTRVLTHRQVPELSIQAMRAVINHFQALHWRPARISPRQVYRVDGAPFYFDQTADMPIKSLLAAIEACRVRRGPSR